MVLKKHNRNLFILNEKSFSFRLKLKVMKSSYFIFLGQKWSMLNNGNWQYDYTAQVSKKVIQ